MSTNTRGVSYDTISEEILKALLLANTNKKKIIAEILSKLNVKPFLDIYYRSIDFTSASLCKCILFMELKGLNQQNLEIYLKTHKNERKKLGLKRSPDQTTISHFNGKILDQESRNKIEIIVKRIEEIAGKRDIILDRPKIKKKEKKRSKKKGNLNYQQFRLSKEITKLFKKRILPFINLNIKNNNVYDKTAFINNLNYMAKKRGFAQSGAQNLRIDNRFRILKCPKCHDVLIEKSELTYEDEDENRWTCLKCGFEKRLVPLGATFRYELKKYHSPAQILKMFKRVYEVLWEMIPDTKALKGANAIVAIDTTDWLYYGKKDNRYIVGTKPQKGTSYCYKFISIDIVQPGKRYTLLVLPITQLDNRNDLLRELIEFARKRVKIKLALLDRGFFNIETQKILNSYGIKYIMPCTQYSNIKEILQKVPTPYIINDFLMGKDFHYNMAIKQFPNKKGIMKTYAYATNITLDTDDPDKEATWLAEEYRKRWGIETGYRIKKSFLPRTTSKDYRIRLFYFLYAVLLYNLWILADVLVWIKIYNRVGQDHKIQAGFFIEIFFFVDSGG